MGLRYPCLVVDHDDTIVNSTATIHYPSFVEYMKIYRPKDPIMSLEDYFRYNFDPGVIDLFTKIVGMSLTEMEEEEAFWNDYVQKHIPSAYAGIKEILWEYKKRGGILCVSSHSFSENILRDYAKNDLPTPDACYGWELASELRKPDPFSLADIMKKFGFSQKELLMLDDLKPGYDMARAAGVTFAAAGWANDVPEIVQFMQKNCDYYFKTVDEFGAFLLN